MWTRLSEYQMLKVVYSNHLPSLWTINDYDISGLETGCAVCCNANWLYVQVHEAAWLSL